MLTCLHLCIIQRRYVQGIFFTYAAANNPSLLVPTKAAGALAATMMGCAATAAFQAAGLMLHLKVCQLGQQSQSDQYVLVNVFNIIFAPYNFNHVTSSQVAMFRRHGIQMHESCT